MRLIKSIYGDICGVQDFGEGHSIVSRCTRGNIVTVGRDREIEQGLSLLHRLAGCWEMVKESGSGRING